MPDHPIATDHDILIVGSGAAGLTAALVLAERARVLVLAKGALDAGSTAWAQGGIAAVLDEGDTFDNHVRDTMIAGAGLNRRETVEFVIENAPAAIARLVELGVPFNVEGRAEGTGLHLTRAGTPTGASSTSTTRLAGRCSRRCSRRRTRTRTSP
jgi:L-aspartate oxidase